MAKFRYNTKSVNGNFLLEITYGVIKIIFQKVPEFPLQIPTVNLPFLTANILVAVYVAGFKIFTFGLY